MTRYRIRFVLSLALLATTFASATAQSAKRPAVVTGEGELIRQGLVLPGGDYYRSAWQADILELQRVAGTWTAPVAGGRIDTARAWQTVRADTSGWISHPDLRGGYFYATVESETGGIMLLEGLGHRQVIVNGEPRSGNIYGFKDNWEPWEPPFDFSFVPVELRPGTNHFLFEGGRAPRMKIRLHQPDTPVVLNTRDLTLPDLLVGEAADFPASVALINAAGATASGLMLTATVDGGHSVTTEIPDLPPLSVRKVPFRIVNPAPRERGRIEVRLTVHRAGNERPIDSEPIVLAIKDPGENHRRTFVSSVDGSVQYYGLNPAREHGGASGNALVLSVHGAAVEAINQSGSYRAKPWAHIVAPTNRRPYGFNWEDWGRLDALEVLEIAESTLDIDPHRVYLTGHSMGGHGTWHLGALYPDRFAAIGPSAGWISFWSYRPRREMEVTSPMEQMLMRATLPSRTMDLAGNYQGLGIYVIHGADDDNVPAEQSRMMVDHLSTFHRDFVYHEEPDAGHWWDKSDEDGADCVDWPPLFDFFARHARPAENEVREIDFVTPNPGVSSCYQWACIATQERPLEMSRVEMRFDPGRERFVGRTTNIELLSLEPPESVGDSVTISIDGQDLTVARADRLWLRRSGGTWMGSAPLPASSKGPHRNGTFKDAFRNRVVLVYGTGGSADENAWALAKARFDAEQFWYQGNGGGDVIPDTEFSPDAFVDRNVVLYGNADTNGAWDGLLGSSPVHASSGRLQVGDRSLIGDNLGALLIRPRPDSDVASVAAVTGTGLAGMRVTDLRPYLSAGFAYPDLVIFQVPDPEEDLDVVVGAGFFGNDWSVEGGEFVWIAE